MDISGGGGGVGAGASETNRAKQKMGNTKSNIIFFMISSSSEMLG